MHINVQIGELSCYPQWQLCYKDLHWLPTLCDCTLGTGRSVEDGGVEMMYWQGEFISLEGLLQHSKHYSPQSALFSHRQRRVSSRRM